MKENVLVTGAYGLLGSHAVRELIENGYHVRAFGRDPDRLQKLAAEYENDQIDIFCGDFCKMVACKQRFGEEYGSYE